MDLVNVLGIFIILCEFKKKNGQNFVIFYSLYLPTDSEKIVISNKNVLLGIFVA